MSLHLITPASSVDYGNLPTFAKQLIKQGPYRGQHFTLAYTSDVPQQAAEEFKKSIEGLFDSISLHASKITGRGWPLGSNQLFRDCAKVGKAKGLPWMFLELDCALLRSGWLKELDVEYAKGGKDFMGAVNPTRGWEEGPGGEKVPCLGEPHMVGFGIYPASFSDTSAKLPFVDILYNWAKTPLEPFDIQIRHEVVPNAHHTDLIQHNLRTVNYRMEGGQIVCDPMTAAHNYAKPVDPRACVLHGCKDSSLADIILSGSPLPETPRIEAGSGAVSAGANAESSHQVAPADLSLVSDGGEVHGSGLSPTAQRIHDLITDSKGRKPRAIAAELALELDDVLAAIADPTSKLSSKPPGWVKAIA